MAAASQYLKLTPNEVALFSRLFSLVEDPNSGVATGSQVSSLFLTSGLPRSTLATIWNIACAGKGGKLDKDGFFVGCRLVALAQQNLPVSQESLLLHRDLPLPIFQGAQQFYPRDTPSGGISTQGGMHQIGQGNSGPMLGQQSASSSMMASMPPAPQMMTPAPVPINTGPGGAISAAQPQTGMTPPPQMVSTAQQTRIMPQAPSIVQQTPITTSLDFTGVPSTSSSQSDVLKSAVNQSNGLYSGSVSRRPSIPIDSLWDISSEKRETYLKYFDQADADKDGFVNGKEAKTFFTMSKLSAAVLRDIWLLSDIDQDNRLNKEEFTIAMHLTMAVRMSGIPVPAQLPDPLMQYYNRQMQKQPSSSVIVSPDGPQTQPLPDLSFPLNQPSSSFIATSAAPTQTSFISHTVVSTVDSSAERPDYARQISSAKAQIEEQKIAIQGYQSRLPNYEEELENIKAEAKLAEDTLAALVVERKQHQAAFEKIRADIATAKSNLQTVNEKIDEERNSIKEYQEQIVQGKRKLDEIRHERDELQKSVDDLKQEIQDKELAVVCLEQEMEELRKQIDHLNEVSSYQMQILSKVTNDHDEKERQRADLKSTKTQLDRIKATASTGATPNSAPISPSKSVGSVEHVWIPPSLNNTPAVNSLASSIVQEEFTFPEFNEDELNDSPLKSAPATNAPIGPVKNTSVVAAEKGTGAEPFRFPSDSVANQALFGADTGAPPFGWDSEALTTSNKTSPKSFEANPFEDEDEEWNPPIKAMSESSIESGKLQSGTSQTQSIDAMAWPAAEFVPSSASNHGEWAQF